MLTLTELVKDTSSLVSSDTNEVCSPLSLSCMDVFSPPHTEKMSILTFFSIQEPVSLFLLYSTIFKAFIIF